MSPDVVVAITVASVGSLRSLFTQDEQSKARPYSPPKLQPLRGRGNKSRTPGSQYLVGNSLGSHGSSNSMAIPLTQLSATPSVAYSLDVSARSRG